MLFDLNAQRTLAAGFAYYKTREAEFRALFTGVSDDVLGAWFTELSDHYPLFRTRNTRGTDEAPMLVVTPQDERVTQTIIGDFDTRDDQGRGVDSYLIRETVEVLIMARSADMARVYHVLTRASIAIARRALHRAGYHLVEYGGASGLAPEEDLAAEELGLYIRRVTVTADRRVSITIPASAEFDVDVYSGDEILVLSSDQTDASGMAGGVDVDV
jgi:hypothetical protein